MRGSAIALDFPDGRFSGAASFHMLHHIPTVDDQDRALAELARVVAKGGSLVAADGVFSEGSQAFHSGDVYNPIDPDDLPGDCVLLDLRLSACNDTTSAGSVPQPRRDSDTKDPDRATTRREWRSSTTRLQPSAPFRAMSDAGGLRLVAATFSTSLQPSKPHLRVTSRKTESEGC